jgi:hypothetical protein
MPLMTDIARPLHPEPLAYQVHISHPSYDPITHWQTDDDQDSDDSRTLAEVVKG